jgi:ADP-ribose pyrophosphatase YjhB (NUDIX family)
MATLLARLYRAIPRPLTRFLLWAANPTFNVGAVGLFLTPDGKLLVLKHVYRHATPWGLPGGYLKRGETAEAGMLRELKEETGLSGIIERVLCVEDVDAFQREVVFVGRVDTTQTMTLNFEIEDAAYVAADQLPKDMLPRHAALVSRLSSPSGS